MRPWRKRKGWVRAGSSRRFDIPEVGRYAVLQNPVGAVFGVLAG